MTLVIGTDEAGYGPNLGPLVVAASAWHVASTPDCTESVLEDAVAEASAISTTTHHGSLWADSKLVYLADISPPFDRVRIILFLAKLEQFVCQLII